MYRFWPLSLRTSCRQWRAAGYGLTTTSIHEVGHHPGMSHPHDGYDSGLDLDYGASFDYGQFDRDNMARYLTIEYINQANSILASIYASPRAGNASAALMAADAHAAAALAAYGTMDYGTAATRAKLAYRSVLAAAAQINVEVEPQNYTADYKAKGRSPKFVDTVDYKRMAP